jgi:hypothetical protein
MGKLIRHTMCGKSIINPPVPYLFNGPSFADIACWVCKKVHAYFIVFYNIVFGFFILT